MTILQSIAIYLLAGTIFSAIIDTAHYLTSIMNPEEHDPDNALTNTERVIAIISWPIGAIAVIRELIRMKRNK